MIIWVYCALIYLSSFCKAQLKVYSEELFPDSILLPSFCGHRSFLHNQIHCEGGSVCVIHPNVPIKKQRCDLKSYIYKLEWNECLFTPVALFLLLIQISCLILLTPSVSYMRVCERLQWFSGVTLWSAGLCWNLLIKSGDECIESFRSHSSSWFSFEATHTVNVNSLTCMKSQGKKNLFERLPSVCVGQLNIDRLTVAAP